MNYLLFVFFAMHLAFTWSMTAVSWFVDVIFYPSYKQVSKKRFQEFEVGYLKKTLFTLLPLMVLEGVTAILLWFKAYHSFLYYPAFANFLLLILIWVMGFRSSLKCHKKLAEEGFHTRVHANLMKIHRWRTLVWSVRALGLLVLAFFISL